MINLKKTLLALVFLLGSQTALAIPPHDQIPQTLQEWIPWVLKDKEYLLCPLASDDEYICDFSSAKLDLELDSKGGSFHQVAQVFSNEQIEIPGEKNAWPQQIQVNGSPAAVIEQEGLPILRLKPGSYEITGHFIWDNLPESLRIPESTALVQVIINNKKLDHLNIQNNHQLWIGAAETTQENLNDSLEMHIHRKITDSIPLSVDTHLNFKVAGSNRELVLDQILLKDFLFDHAEGDLNVQMDEQNRFHIQLKPGTWNLHIFSRSAQNITQIQLFEKNEETDIEEIWVFAAQNQIRMVDIEGLNRIDPSQSSLPESWKNLPAYWVNPGQTMKLSEKHRGFSPEQDQLQFYRQAWIDFNGKGISFKDQITGQLKKNWRLDMVAPYALQKVSLNNANQLITYSPDKIKQGVELRSSDLNINSESRIENRSLGLPSTGWNQNFQRASMELNLPPGWRLLTASGVETAQGSWLSEWNLMAFFLVLLFTLLAYKLWDIPTSIVFFTLLILSYNETDAPRFIWLFLLISILFKKILTKGFFQKLANATYAIMIVLFLLITIPYTYLQIQNALFPILKTDTSKNYYYPIGGFESKQAPNPQMMKPQVAKEIDGALNAGAEEDITTTYNEPNVGKDEMMQQQSYKSDRYLMKAKKKMLLNQADYQPGAKVQVGQGLPQWNWQRVQLNWNGPVHPEDKLHLWLISPLTNIVLTLLQLVLLGMVVRKFLPLPSFSLKPASSLLWIVGFLSILSYAHSAYAEIPNQELLNELSTRLSEKPKCSPNCVDIPSMLIIVDQNQLQLQLAVASQSFSAIALPGNLNEWMPESITLDGNNKPALRRDENGTLWLQVSEGAHQITMQGSLGTMDHFSLSIPDQPQFTQIKSSDWKVDGLLDKGQVSDSLQFTRNIKNNENKNENKISQTGIPFVEVERNIYIGLNWYVETKITRMGNNESPIVLSLPLLAGESITSSDLKVEDNKVLVSLNAQNQSLSWESVLTESPQLALVAQQNNLWQEVWKLHVSPIWNISWEGIPPLHPLILTQYHEPVWRPWTSEKVLLKFNRPEGVKGQTLTIDSSEVTVQPGLRNSHVQLQFSIKSTLGGQHFIKLPANINISKFEVNHVATPANLQNNQLSVPVIPGENNYVIEWDEPTGLKLFYKNPQIDFGAEQINHQVHVDLMNANRWVIFLSGPGMGPVAIIWIQVILLLIMALFLKNIQTPLHYSHWILLGLGLSQIDIIASLIVVGWFWIFAARNNKLDVGKLYFNARQLLLFVWTLVFVGIFIIAIYQSLLGQPEMQITGNNSYQSMLHWYMDRIPALTPRILIISTPMWFYKLCMFMWSLWLSFSLMKWFKWAWESFQKEGYWRKS